MKFFFDNTLPPDLADGFAAFEKKQRYTVEALRERFDCATPDPEWLRSLGVEGGWVVLTGDDRIYSHPANLAAWMEAGLTVFFLLPPFQNAKFWVQAAELARMWPDIVDRAKRFPTGHGFRIPMKGRPQQFHPPVRR